MAPGFHSPPPEPSRTVIVRYYGAHDSGCYANCDTNVYVARPNPDDLKAARLRWLAFTRGNGRSETCCITESHGADRVSLYARLQPGLKMRRRPKIRPRPRTMKQIRRIFA